MALYRSLFSRWTDWMARWGCYVTTEARVNVHLCTLPLCVRRSVNTRFNAGEASSFWPLATTAASSNLERQR